MANTVNVDFVTKVVEIEVDDNRTESIATMAAVNAAQRAQEARNVVVDNLDATVAVLDAKAVEKEYELDAYTDLKKAEIDEAAQQYVEDAAISAESAANSAAAAAKIVDVGVDPTLTVEDAAADAKATGDKIAESTTVTSSEMSLFGVDDLLWKNCTFASKTQAGVTWSVDTINKKISLTGTATGVSFLLLSSSGDPWPSWLTIGKTYILHMHCPNKVKIEAWVKKAGQSSAAKIAETDNVIKLKMESDFIGIGFRLYISSGTVTNTVIRPFISECPSIGEIVEEVSEVIDNCSEDAEMELYTEFDWSVGRNTATGTYTNSGYHSDLKKIRPETTYYIGYESDSDAIRFAFYDRNKNFIGVNYEHDLTEVNYRHPDATGSASFTYAKIFSFQSPANAYYLSMNSSRVDNVEYRQYVSSKPVFAYTNTGNFRVLKSDSAYQKYKDRKLCMFGTSFLMTDRLQSTGNFNEGEDTTRFVVGIPEYLLPWWDTCDVYGYSSAPMMPGTSSSVRSLYDRIVTDQLDVSGYDDFIITRSSSGVTDSNIGELTSPTDLGDVNTYVGSLRRIIDYIYTQNPNASIWLQTNVSRLQFGDSSLTATYGLLNQAIKDTAELLFLPVIDCEKEGFNAYNASLWCYDSNGHLNHDGAKNVGQFFRKCILGF